MIEKSNFLLYKYNIGNKMLSSVTPLDIVEQLYNCQLQRFTVPEVFSCWR